MTVGHLPSLLTFSEEALKEARELKTPDMGEGSNVGDPFRNCFTGVNDAFDIGDASLLLEEAQRFITQAISRFRVDLSQCEVELQKVSRERDALRLLCSQKDKAIKGLQENLAKARKEEAELDKQIGSLREEVDQIKAECNRRKETIDRLTAKKETILTNLLSADVQLQNAKQKGSAQAKRIDELEARFAEAKAEVESSKILVDKSIAIYRADAEATQMEENDDASSDGSSPLTPHSVSQSRIDMCDNPCYSPSSTTIMQAMVTNNSSVEDQLENLTEAIAGLTKCM
ncbi:uncharacterized protein [Nicotiana tomentosiformis]|uniref:uncharacterized protein n=1 Tax=Nicotiana tomentosiformis TaxID=4098 RepID=UPI00388C9811